MGGLEQLHPLLPAPATARSWAWGAGRAEEIPKAAGTASDCFCLCKRRRETEIRRERKREGEREREQAPGLGVGGVLHNSHLSNLWHSPPPPDPLHGAATLGLPALRGGPWGSGMGKGAYLTGCSNMCPCAEALPGSRGGFLSSRSKHLASHWQPADEHTLSRAVWVTIIKWSHLFCQGGNHDNPPVHTPLASPRLLPSLPSCSQGLQGKGRSPPGQRRCP